MNKIISKSVLRVISFLSIDFFGMLGSFVCALHCLSLPILTLLLPISNVTFLLEIGFDFGMIFFSFCLGLSSLLHGYFHHHSSRLAISFFLMGFATLVLGMLSVGSLFHYDEHFFLAIGGFMLTFAHFLNWHLSRLKNIACSCSFGKGDTT